MEYYFFNFLHIYTSLPFIRVCETASKIVLSNTSFCSKFHTIEEYHNIKLYTIFNSIEKGTSGRHL